MELQLKEVKKSYGNFHLEVSLHIAPGQITGLVGKNGAGKSTTIKSVLGLIRPDGGEVLIDGKPVSDLTEKERENLGVVLADSGFSGYLCIKDIIPILRTMYSAFDEDFFREQCKEQELPLDKQIRNFSTGMAAKLKVLVAISHDAKLLVLDEPTSGLDVMARNEILDLLREYMEKDEERSILISSHISSDLESLCDDIYIINKGKILLHEDTDAILANYGVLKLSPEDYEGIEKEYLLRVKKEKFGYSALTKEKAFFAENYPAIALEKGNIDDVYTMMIQGEEA